MLNHRKRSAIKSGFPHHIRAFFIMRTGIMEFLELIRIPQIKGTPEFPKVYITAYDGAEFF